MKEEITNTMLIHGEFNPEQMAIAREVWQTIGHYFQAWEHWERDALSEPRINYQLQVWLACSRAWERYFANHPESKSEHAKKCAAVLLVGISLGHKELKPKWGELLTIYGEIAKEMGLPETSPPSIMKVLPGKYPRGEDIPLVPIQPVG